MDITQYEIEIKHHAFIRAMQRKITPDVVEATIKGGTLIKFGKNYVKFCKRYKDVIIVCVGQIVSQKIKIITITSTKIKRIK